MNDYEKPKTIQIVLDKDLKVISSSSLDMDVVYFSELIDKESFPGFNKILQNLKPDESTQIEEEINFAGVKEKYMIDVLMLNDHYFLSFFPITYIQKLKDNVHKFQELAFTDQLTGLLNRYAYRSLLINLIYNAERSNEGLGVVFVDIDNLKEINTTKGYLAGDNCLKSVAECIKTHMRKGDLLIRLGGDEFLVVFKDKDVGEDKIQKVSGRLMECITDNRDNITVSIGATYIKAHDVSSLLFGDWNDNWNRILTVADKYVKKAKLEGKGKIIVK